MKYKFLFIPLVCVQLIAPGFLSADQASVQEANAAVLELLDPINEHPDINFSFQAIQLDIEEDYIGGFEGVASVERMIDETPIEISLRAIFEDRGKIEPSITLDMQSNIDLLPLIDPEDVQKMMGEFPSKVMEYQAKIQEIFGDAASFEYSVEKMQFDSLGNLKALSLNLSLTIDLDKLPKRVPSGEVSITQITLKISFDPLEGDRVLISAVLNRDGEAYYEVQERGLETCGKILHRNPEFFFKIRRDLMQFAAFLSGFTE